MSDVQTSPHFLDRVFGTSQSERVPFLPDDWSDLGAVSAEMGKRVLARGLGATLLVLAVMCIVALVTSAPNDPSFDYAAPVETQNWLGTWGATWMGLASVWFGITPLAIALLLCIWGYWLIDGRTELDLVRRIPAGLCGAALFTAGLTALNDTIASTAPGGLGGLTGHLINSLLTSGTDSVSAPFLAWPLGMLVGLAGLALYVWAGAINPLRWQLPEWPSFQDWRGPRIQMPQLSGSWPWSRRASSDEDTETEADLEDDEPSVADLPVEDPCPPRPRKRVEPRMPGLDVIAPVAKPDLRILRTEKPAAGKRLEEEAQPALDLEEDSPYELPPLTLLAKPKDGQKITRDSDELLETNARRLEEVLGDFSVRGRIGQVRPGPVVTLYELEPAAGIRSSRVISLADDIARSMSAVSARVAAVPGRNVIGIELPNQKRETVYLRELLASAEFEKTPASLTLALGKDIGGAPVVADLARMPHLLIAGTTGSGKSVAINTMILSLLYRLPPDICKLIMIDPKMLELSVYDGIPHLLTPVVTDPKKAVVALKWTVREMEDRYRRMSKLGVRNIHGYNERIAKAAQKGESLTRQVQTGFDATTGQPQYEEEDISLSPMPFIVVIVDEMADLMLVAGKDIEGAVQRLAQMARAAGIHIIMATQRPSVDVITGTIKANFPTRISFQVTSKIDSRTILGEQGAEQLLGQGDMLHMEGGGRIRRVHGPFVSDGEVEEIVKFLKAQGEPDYLDDITVEPETPEGEAGSLEDGDGEGGDDLYDKAVAIVARDRKASTSYVQRRLQIGYNRAARLIEKMEEQGVVSAPNHSGKREVLVGEH